MPEQPTKSARVVQTATDNRLVIEAYPAGGLRFFRIDRQYLVQGSTDEWATDPEAGICEHAEYLDDVIRALEACRAGQ